ncbi:MAG: hypothetical protein AB1452_09280 [Pseudomonadota bacterium]
MRRRAWFVALALVAMLFIGARPLCEAAGTSGGALHAAMTAALGHSVGGHDSSASTCCVSAESGTLATVSKAWALTPDGGKLALLAAVFMLWAVPVLSRAAATPFRSDPRSLSYYIRSARILR